MADNVTTQTSQLSTIPDGTVIATDTVGGVLYQRVKVVWGADGTVTDTDTASGAALPAQLRNSTGTEIATAAAPLRTDPTGTTAQPVTDNAGSLTVDAPVATPVFVRLSDGAAAISALPVTDNSGSLTVDNGGTFAVQATQSGTWNIGTVTTLTGITNVVHVDDNSGSLTVDYATTGSGTATGALRVELPTNGTGVVGLNAGTNTIGKTYRAYQTAKALTTASVSISSSGDNTIVSGTASQTIRVHRLLLVAAAAVNVTLKDATAGTALTGAIPLTANGSLSLDDSNGEPMFISASGGNFVVNLSGAQTVTGFVQYTKS